jgi:hypothetical protein
MLSNDQQLQCVNLNTLPALCPTIKIFPSEKIYFKIHAYKVVIHTPQFERLREAYRSMEKILNQFSGKYRLKLTKTHYDRAEIHVYIQKLSDLDLFIQQCEHKIASVFGPIDEEHLKMMKSKQGRYLIRSRLWFNKYDCKAYCRWGVWGLDRSFAETRQTSIELCDFFRTQMECKTQICGGDVAIVRVHCDHAQLNEMMPFLKLSFPRVNIRIEKCILKDK